MSHSVTSIPNASVKDETEFSADQSLLMLPDTPVMLKPDAGLYLDCVVSEILSKLDFLHHNNDIIHMYMYIYGI